jgi:NAD(P)-dependent dehydrogenase (short-subunit alcohol dehydrogenase family)
MTASKGVALVTGVSSGIGKDTASALAAAGYRVFGSARSNTSEIPEGVERVILDVRDEASIQAAVTEVLTRAGRIDVLVNNAGGSILGAIEETDIQQAQELFDVNFFGAVRATRAVLPTMRAQKSGRIVFIGSVVGFIPAPFMGFYAASKHAIEGYAESLDHEVRTLGIRVVVIEPGFMKTRIDQSAGVANRAIPDYAAARERVGLVFTKSMKRADDPVLVARAVVETLEAREPRLRYQVGKGAGTLATLRSLLPAAMFSRSLRKQFHLDA